MARKSKPPDGPRKKQRVRTAKRRESGSTRWLERQLNDPYVHGARREGWRSRAAYKIIQMDEDCHLFKPGQRVVDLGAAPGGWTQVAVQKVRPQETGGCVIALDYLEMEPVAGAEFIQLDFYDDDAPEKLKAALGGPADVVLSDMAAPTTGHHNTDHMRIVGLAEAAFHFAAEVLNPGGAFVAKVFQGGTENELLALLKKHFTKVRHVKPPASRSDSSEIYVVATGFRG